MKPSICEETAYIPVALAGRLGCQNSSHGISPVLPNVAIFLSIMELQSKFEYVA